MNAESAKLWRRFLAHAARARAKPTFDAEERDWKLSTADQLREALRSARDGGEWLPIVKEVFSIGGSNFNLTVPAHRDWFKAWAEAEPESLRNALVNFLDREKTPEHRLAAFARAADEVEATARIAPDANGILALGSLFNFALEPETLPMMRTWHFAMLEQILEPESGRVSSLPVDAAYARHLEFAFLTRSRMEESGFPVRDMIDVQSLMFIAAREHDFWTPSEPYVIGQAPSREGEATRQPPVAGDKAYLSVCAVYRDEAPYLREWIEFHRLVGVQRFFLYDNLSTDSHRQALEPYLEDGIAILHEWKAEPLDQRTTYDHCLAEHGSDSRWIAFLDLDEFLFSPTGRSLPEILVDYERWPGVGVNWSVFGTSGHHTKPAGLVIENYLTRVDAPANRFIKSIVDPTRVSHCATAHHFSYDSLLTVDENHYPIHDLRSKSVSFSRLRINHYVTRSEAEARAKSNRGAGWNHSERWRTSRLEDTYPQEIDRTITAYVPAVREALAVAAARRPDPTLTPTS
jgi:hypothetical protein